MDTGCGCDGVIAMAGWWRPSNRLKPEDQSAKCLRACSKSEITCILGKYATNRIEHFAKGTAYRCTIMCRVRYFQLISVVIFSFTSTAGVEGYGLPV